MLNELLISIAFGVSFLYSNRESSYRHYLLCDVGIILQLFLSTFIPVIDFYFVKMEFCAYNDGLEKILILPSCNSVL